MPHRTIKQAIEFGTAMMFGGAFMAAAALIFVLGPHVEGEMFPVVDEVKFISLPYTTEQPDEDRIYLAVTGEKVRTCRFIEVRTLVLRDGVWVLGDTQFGPEPKVVRPPSISSRPLGVQSFGSWVITPKGVAIKFEAVHHCHSLWDTVTQLGAWEAKDNVQSVE